MHTYKADLIRVIDGDTIVCDIDLGFGIWVRDEHVRLARINTPETRTRDLVEKSAGLKAKEFVHQKLKEMMVLDGYLVLETFKASGKFGRFIAEVVVFSPTGENYNLNDLLVKEGHAVLADY